ncbi:hypothetical protein HUE87_02365 [Candidatus Sulfurimonas marisnigri]|uniref:Uncharacterized protein n=1 Tax=Candidatus Sulfurimonas marisnigri TaxID=2740405 RepID=A0A7S7M161_9BACT|nr:hypothetical protein [Candidatus Sulfurimonas marisnigri]QOY55105.1 hypothetical protein HUE87_02365 [Candidatus Sulfurimonas marisnigri]
MKSPFLLSIFKKNIHVIKHLNTILIKKLKKLCKSNDLIIYENITIYHYSKKTIIPLLIIDANRGIYIFEHKEWSFDDLKNSTISKSSHQSSTDQSLSYENRQEFIKQKFNELSHSDGVPIYNFLLMENLDRDQYDYLDDSFKILLPFEKIIFNDTLESELAMKLQENIPILKEPSKLIDIIGNLFIQYTIIDDMGRKYVATQEQIEFIDYESNNTLTIYAEETSGKTSAIILKALLYVLKYPKKNVVIVKPTIFDCDMLKHILNITIEYSMVEVDIDAINIVTPEEFTSRKIKKSDLIICDDTELLEHNFLTKIKTIQKNRALILVTSDKNVNPNFSFSKQFRLATQNFVFKKENQNNKVLEIISNLLKNNSAKDILVFSNSQNREILLNKLELLVPGKAGFFDCSDNLIDQDLSKILLQTYENISTLGSKFILLTDVESIPFEIIEYTAKRCSNTTYIIYKDQSEKINNLITKLA